MNISIKTQIWQNGDIFLESASAKERVSLTLPLLPAICSEGGVQAKNAFLASSSFFDALAMFLRFVSIRPDFKALSRWSTYARKSDGRTQVTQPSGLTTTIWGVGKPCCILELRNKFRENKREQEVHCETDRRGTCSSSPDAFRRESSGTQTPPRPHLAQSRCKSRRARLDGRAHQRGAGREHHDHWASAPTLC
jgi:hypothetical protein